MGTKRHLPVVIPVNPRIVKWYRMDQSAPSLVVLPVPLPLNSLVQDSSRRTKFVKAFCLDSNQSQNYRRGNMDGSSVTSDGSVSQRSNWNDLGMKSMPLNLLFNGNAQSVSHI